MAKYDDLPKKTYDNADGSGKDTQTIPTQVGAWDMEQITGKTNELAAFVKQGYDTSVGSPTKQFALQNDAWTEVVPPPDSGPDAGDNVLDIVTFKNIHGTWVNSPTAPLTTAITFDYTDALNGAVTAVYYRAPTLEIVDSGNKIVMQSLNAFTADALCIVWFAYDGGSDKIHVNVQSSGESSGGGSDSLVYDLVFDLTL